MDIDGTLSYANISLSGKATCILKSRLIFQLLEVGHKSVCLFIDCTKPYTFADYKMSESPPRAGLRSEPQRLPKAAERRQAVPANDAVVEPRSVSLEVAMLESLDLDDKLAAEAASEEPKQALKRFLSIGSVVSTSSSFAERQQAAVHGHSEFKEIGTGSTAKVFEHPGTTWVYKLTLLDRSEKLWNNYLIQRRVEESFATLRGMSGQCEVPKAIWFASPSTNAFWTENLNRFPDSAQFPRRPRDTLCLERIFPLPKPIRDILINLYCGTGSPREESMKAAARADPANKDCLVRPLLGRKRYGPGSTMFSLRNFKLHLNQIKDIKINGHELAMAMADTLAVLHWHTKIDAMDIEFVLGSSPVGAQIARRAMSSLALHDLQIGTSTFERVTNSGTNFMKRVTSLWILDFDACQNITMDESGVDKAVRAFYDTEAYAPRPLSDDPYGEELWKIFSTRYVSTGTHLLDDGKLPRLFISKLIEMRRDMREPSMNPPVGASTPSRRGSVGTHPRFFHGRGGGLFGRGGQPSRGGQEGRGRESTAGRGGRGFRGRDRANSSRGGGSNLNG